MRELRYAFRQLVRQPGFTILAVVALALGIGANTVLFSAINTLFLRPLSYPEPQQLARVWGSFPERGLDRANVSWPRFQAWRDGQQSFTEFSAQSFTGFTMTGRGDPQNLNGVRVTENFFRALGVQPLFGRVFTPEEDKPGGANVAVLTHTFWQKQFGGDQSILGKAVTLNGVPFTVIGILSPALKFPFIQTHIFIPRVFEQEGLPPDIIERGTGYLTILARLKPGVTKEQAEQQLRIADRRYQTSQSDKVDAKAGMSVVSLHEDLVGRQRPLMLTLFAAVGCVLLVGCANVANLLLARGASRAKEIGIRLALGASRHQIIRQLLAESIVLGMVGSAFGLLFAVWGVDLMLTALPNEVPYWIRFDFDWRIFSFALGIGGLSSVLFGIVPALQASNPKLVDALKEGGRTGAGGAKGQRMRNSLVIAEVALALVLLVGAGLLLKSFVRLQNVHPGFDPKNVLTMEVSLPVLKYPRGKPVADFYAEATRRIKALPGVEAAAFTSILPLSGTNSDSSFAIEGRDHMAEKIFPDEEIRNVTPEYFSVLKVPLLQGRFFNDGDQFDGPQVTIVNNAFAKRWFPNQEAVGKRITFGDPRKADAKWVTIVGVVGDMRHRGLDLDVKPEYYNPHNQIPYRGMILAVRSAQDPRSLTSAIRREISKLDPDLPAANVRTLEQVAADSIAPRRLSVVLIGVFAAVALVLASVGIYGVMSFLVVQRTHEMGVRMALGAQRGDVLRLVIGRAAKLVLIGTAAGLVLGIMSSSALRALLFNVGAFDPMTFAAVTFALIAVSLLASYIPALRATKADPMIALGHGG